MSGTASDTRYDTMWILSYYLCDQGRNSAAQNRRVYKLSFAAQGEITGSLNATSRLLARTHLVVPNRALFAALVRGQTHVLTRKHGAALEVPERHGTGTDPCGQRPTSTGAQKATPEISRAALLNKRAMPSSSQLQSRGLTLHLSLLRASPW